ncbi:MAG: rhomboid family intramembrane serine protease [Devosia sp.]
MSESENDLQNQPDTAPPARQPIFLLPAPVTALCGVLVAINVGRSWLINPAADESILAWLSFFPYRIIDPASVEGGWLPIIWTPFTHAFLHQGWEHLLLNTVWLAIFATPVANRYGGWAMLAIFLIGAFAGALAFAATTLPHLALLLGASGGIAALTAAAIRFIFQPPIIAVDPETGERRILGRRLASVREVIASPNARIFALVWIVLNGIVPLLPVLTGMDLEIAWQAHLGGFAAGFFLVPLFERRG